MKEDKEKRPSKQKKHLKLKKIGRKIYTFISKVYSVIDKYIITPLSKFLMLITNIFKTNNRPLDRLLNNKKTLIILSLILALIAFFTVDNMADVLLNNQADVIYNQKVTALYNEEAYVIEGLPETANITMIGNKSVLYLAKQYPNDDIVVDLRDLKPGTHKVDLKYNGSGAISSVDYQLNPSSATVVIYEKVSQEKTISKEILNVDKLDSKYNIENVTFNRDNVFVKAADYKLEQVAMVKALLNVEDITNPTAGTMTIKDIPLVAYDKDGNKLDVELVPKSIDAKIEISSPSKKVPFEVETTGTLAFGHAIESIKLSAETATIYGPQEILNNITSIPVKIDISDLSKDKEFNINVTKPTGVNEISVPALTVTVKLSEIEEKTIDDVSIEIRSIPDNLTALASTPEETTVSVIVKGSKNNIEDITKENIVAYVDLSGLGVGTHKVEVHATGNDPKLTYTPKTTTITIIIKEK